MVKSEESKRLLKGALVYILTPLVLFALFYGILAIRGVSFLEGPNFKIFTQNLVYMGLIGFAVSLNVPSGRFDFSVGSIMVLSSILGGNIALQLGLNSLGMVVLFAIFGALLGTLSGVIYVVLRLPAMVTSIGVMLIFESIAFAIYGGNGLVLIGEPGMFFMASNTFYLMMLLALAFLLIFFLNRYTSFGYSRRALIGGQKIAIQTGIKEKRIAIICYGLAGMLVGIAGLVPVYQAGTVAPQLGMGTIMIMFSGFLAMFIGGFLSRWGDYTVGVLIGAIISALIDSFLAHMSFSMQEQTIINAFILLAFLVFDQYFDKIVEFTKRRTSIQ